MSSMSSSGSSGGTNQSPTARGVIRGPAAFAFGSPPRRALRPPVPPNIMLLFIKLLFAITCLIDPIITAENASPKTQKMTSGEQIGIIVRRRHSNNDEACRSLVLTKDGLFYCVQGRKEGDILAILHTIRFHATDQVDNSFNCRLIAGVDPTIVRGPLPPGRAPSLPAIISSIQCNGDLPMLTNLVHLKDLKCHTI